MYKIAFIALLSLPLVAGFFPSTFKTSVSSVDGKTIKLKKSFPVTNMSGIVVHSYARGIRAATTYIVQSSNKEATIVNNDTIHHDELPTIKTAVKAGDRVIGGYLYNNVLLLAPDAETYAKITSTYHKRWIHPDLYAVYIFSEDEDVPTLENLSDFANKYKIGLICVVRKNDMVLIDPISQKHIASKSFKSGSKDAKFPFYMRVDNLNNSSWFGSSKKGNYYNMVESL